MYLTHHELESSFIIIIVIIITAVVVFIVIIVLIVVVTITAESFLQLFEALTGESWTGNIWNSMAAVGPAACLFWIAWDIIGHKILLNLFLAILINNFQDQEAGLHPFQLPLTLKNCDPHHWSQDPAHTVPPSLRMRQMSDVLLHETDA